MIEVTAVHRQSAVVPVSADKAFEIIGVPGDSIRHFSGLESLAENDGVWTWKLDRLGAGKVSLQVVYACRYDPNADARTVTWVPVDGIGNGRVSGKWTVTPKGDDQCTIAIENTLSLKLDLNWLLKKPAQAVVERENRRLIEAYVANLVKTLSGGDGRVFNP